MKYSIKKACSYLAGFVIMLQVSCSKDVFTNANNNPNAPPTVTPGNILPGVETNLAYTQGGDFTRYANLLVQQNVGFSRQSQAYYTYIFTSTDFDSPWGNMYTSVLGNDKDMMNKADAAGYNVYSGISRIIMAYSLQLLVDDWGDVPYTEALQGSANTHPTYNSAQALYDTIANLVDVAIGQLSNPNPGGQTPSSDDLMYGGDASLWIKFGHAIKARLYLHQSNGNASMAANALTEADMSFADISETAQFQFGTAETFANPIYEFNEQRGDIDYGAGAYADLLTSLNDPRLGHTSDPTYSDQQGYGVGDYYGAINGHVEFITYDELQLLKAEATLRASGNIATAQGFYQAGITASMQKLGISDADIATYIAANGTLPTTSVANAIAAVATQQYIALYLNPEAFTTWRRTGYPVLTPTAGSNGVPRRFLYPQNEYSLNAANTPAATLFSPKIFWDK
jgi:hypothetical protein